MRCIPLILILLGTLGFTPAGADSPPAAPKGVVALATPEQMLVIWAATPEEASAELVTYRVYGRLGNLPVHLADVPGDATRYAAPYGFDAYGVSASRGGLESTIAWSADCIYMNLREVPPDVGIDHYCKSASRGPVKVRAP